MDCCGRKRRSLQAIAVDVPQAMGSVAAPGRTRRTTSNVVEGGRSVALRYRERAAVRVRGPATGRIYAFSAGEPTQQVDARDAGSLLRTGRFIRVEPREPQRKAP